MKEGELYQSVANSKIFTYKGLNDKGEYKLESSKGITRYVTKSDFEMLYKPIKKDK